jgi:hypothetical protein
MQSSYNFTSQQVKKAQDNKQLARRERAHAREVAKFIKNNPQPPATPVQSDGRRKMVRWTPPFVEQS